MIRLLWTVLLVSLSLSACGRKGPLVRPESLVPARASDFRAIQRGEVIQLDWSIPRRMESGGKLTDLAGFRVFRREVGDCADCPESWRLLRQLDLEYLQGGERVADKMFFTERSATQDTGYEYRLVPFTKSSSEGPPSTVRITRRAPLSPPHVKASSSHAAILLECVSEPLPEGYSPKGYAIYRNRHGENAPLAPTATITEDGRFEDTLLEQGVDYTYRVARVAGINGQSVEGIQATLTARLSTPD